MFLQRMLKGFKTEDPQVKHQKCLPIQVFKSMWNNNRTTMSQAIGQLVTGAVFFGMRSCEYSKVEGTRKTKIIRICDLTFRYKNKIIPIRKDRLHLLKYATSISVTFRDQKNGNKCETITMPSTSSTDGFGPTQAWAAIVVRILSYPETSISSPVNTV